MFDKKREGETDYHRHQPHLPRIANRAGLSTLIVFTAIILIITTTIVTAGLPLSSLSLFARAESSMSKGVITATSVAIASSNSNSTAGITNKGNSDTSKWPSLQSTLQGVTKSTNRLSFPPLSSSLTPMEKLQVSNVTISLTKGNKTSPGIGSANQTVLLPPPLTIISPPLKNETGLKAPPLYPHPIGAIKTVPPTNTTSIRLGINIAELTLIPSSANPGSILTVGGKGFGANQVITIAIDNYNNNTSVKGRINSTTTTSGQATSTNSTTASAATTATRTDENGTFVAYVRLPVDIAIGDHEIFARDSNGVIASASLKITQAPVVS